jgi:hypothetical protein
MEGLRFPTGRNAHSEDWDSSGHVRERVALETLVCNKWLEAERAGGELRIKLGEWRRRSEKGPEADRRGCVGVAAWAVQGVACANVLSHEGSRVSTQ